MRVHAAIVLMHQAHHHHLSRIRALHAASGFQAVYIADCHLLMRLKDHLMLRMASDVIPTLWFRTPCSRGRIAMHGMLLTSKFLQSMHLQLSEQ